MSGPLDKVDLTQSLTKEESAARILKAQRHLTHLRLYAAGLIDTSVIGPGIVVLFEGFDAAGKGGAIRRVTSALDPRHVRVVPIGPPTPEEKAHHFLWRFSETVPARGAMTVYDRSWYGRLLVERVEGLIDEKTRRRSAVEICEFERALVEDGTIVVKFWLQISEEEQLKRFLERENDPLKHWKLTPDDWENRKHRDDYIAAMNDVLETTDHDHSRWDVIAAENKHFARVAVLETLNKRLEHGLSHLGFDVPESRGEDYLGK